MHEAIPYITSPTHVKSWPEFKPGSIRFVLSCKKTELIKTMVEENAVIVFARTGCCLSHVAKRLLQGVGANPPVYEVDDKDENDVVRELEMGLGIAGPIQFPAVFIGGRWFGGLDRVLTAHIAEELAPLLKKAGALWL